MCLIIRKLNKAMKQLNKLLKIKKSSVYHLPIIKLTLNISQYLICGTLINEFQLTIVIILSPTTHISHVYYRYMFC